MLKKNVFKDEKDEMEEEKKKADGGIKLSIKEAINSFKNFIEITYKDIFRYMKLDKFLVTFLIMKYKSGFILDINSNGLTNVFNDLYYTEVKEDKKK